MWTLLKVKSDFSEVQKKRRFYIAEISWKNWQTLTFLFPPATSSDDGKELNYRILNILHSINKRWDYPPDD